MDEGGGEALITLGQGDMRRTLNIMQVLCYNGHMIVIGGATQVYDFTHTIRFFFLKNPKYIHCNPPPFTHTHMSSSPPHTTHTHTHVIITPSHSQQQWHLIPSHKRRCI